MANSGSLLAYGKIILNPVPDLASRGQFRGELMLVNRLAGHEYALDLRVDDARCSPNHLACRFPQVFSPRHVIHGPNSVIDVNVTQGLARYLHADFRTIQRL